MVEDRRPPWQSDARRARLSDLPPALLARARRRLTRSALVAFALLVLTQVASGLFFLWQGYSAAYRYGPSGDIQSAVLFLLLWLICRIRRIGDATVLRIGIAAEVVICASLSWVATHTGHWIGSVTPSFDPSTLVIAVFPLIVPSPPRTTAIVSFLSAAMAPLGVVFFMIVPFGVTISAPLIEALSLSAYPAIAAVIAYSIARVRHDAYVDADEVRQERALLETLLEQVGAAVVLVDAAQRIVYANVAAKEMLLAPGGAPGTTLEEALDERVRAAGHSFLEEGDATLTIMRDGEPEVLQVARRTIEVGFRPHGLLVARRITEALRARETAAYKRVIRIFVHELGNSLAPISSILHSAQRVLGDPQHATRLHSVFSVVRERIKHLGDFLERYARLARLPAPRPAPVAWRPFLAEIGDLHPFQLVSDPPAGDACFDPGQLQQVLLNLLKNAEEAGGPRGDTEIEISHIDGELCVRVSDRGAGLSDEAWRNAMTPLFSTKPKGSGLGLALCREILEAHGGRIGLFPREGGGTTVRCWLPDRPAPA